MTDRIIIRQKMHLLPPEVQAFIADAETGKTNRFHETRPSVISIIYSIGFSLTASMGGVIIMLIPFVTGDGFMWVTTIVGTVAVGVLGSVFMIEGVSKLMRRRHHDHYYLIVHPEALIERSHRTVTLIPRHAVTGAYDSAATGANRGSCVVYRSGEGTDEAYLFLKNEYPFGKTLPSPVIKKIQQVYGVQDPTKGDEY